MKTLKQLEAEFKINSKEGFRLRDEIETLRLEKIIPKLRRKYEGRFWKYDNSTSNEDHWPLYSYCHTIINDREAIFDSFELRNNGSSEFNLEFTSYFFLCQTEITKEEYMKAMIEFQNKVIRLNRFV